MQQQLAKGKPTPTLFTTTDEDFHAAIKRPISGAYSMSTLTEFEPFVDKTIATLFKRLDEFVTKNQVCDIAVWLQYCTRFCIDTCLACMGLYVISVLTYIIRCIRRDRGVDIQQATRVLGERS